MPGSTSVTLLCAASAGAAAARQRCRQRAARRRLQRQLRAKARHASGKAPRRGHSAGRAVIHGNGLHIFQPEHTGRPRVSTQHCAVTEAEAGTRESRQT